MATSTGVIPKAPKQNLVDLKPADVLKRYLYLLNGETRYIAGNPYVHKCFLPEKLICIEQLVTENRVEEVIPIIVLASEDKFCTRKDPHLFALAVCARSSNQKLQTAAYSAVSVLCTTAGDLFTFIKFFIQVSEHKGFGMGFRKCVNKWYLSYDPLVLADIVSFIRGACGWSHKDVLKMTHPKPNDKEKEAIFTYIKYGLKEASRKFGVYPQTKNVLQHFEIVENFKHCEDGAHQATMIETHNLKLEHVPGHFLKSKDIWSALIPSIPYRQLLEVLPRLDTCGLLKNDSPILKKVLQYLGESHRIKGAALHPVEVLIALKNYEHHGRAPDFKKSEYLKEKDIKDGVESKPVLPPNSAVTNALYTVLNTSFSNLKPTGLKYMICMDTRAYMNATCFKCRNVSAFDAAVIMALSILKTEQDVVISVFHDKGIHVLNFNKGITRKDASVRLRKAPKGHVHYQKPFEWAEKKKRNIDVFIYMFHSHRVYFKVPKTARTPSVPLGLCLHNYMKKMNTTKTKLICMSLCSHSRGSNVMYQGMLDVCGFDENVPRIISSFIAESFQ